MRLMRNWCSLLLLLLAGCYDSSFGEADGEATRPGTISIGAFKAMVPAEGCALGEEMSISGTVTTDDRAGNFRHRIAIESRTEALMLLADVEHLHNDFPEGCVVTLHLKGLHAGWHNGVLQVGTTPPPGSGFPTGMLPSPAALRLHLQRGTEHLQPLQPERMDLGELDRGDCGRLIRIDDVALADTPAKGERPLWSGYHRFRDRRGNEIRSYVSPYATFSQTPVPEGRCSITGILEQTASGFILKPRHEQDCTDSI